MNLDKKYLIKLINRYREGSASEEEIIILVRFYKYCQKTNDWPKEISNKDVVLKELFSKIKNKTLNSGNKKAKIRYLQFSKVLKYAAVFLILLGAAFLYNQDYFDETQKEINSEIAKHNIKKGTSKAILTLANGTEIKLDENLNYSNNNAKSNGTEITYNKSEAKAETAYNYLTIPRGGQYHIKLSDGTEVWLNSESQLKYPISFKEGGTRKVELVYGEAYFDVSPSSNHKGVGFKVYNKSQEVQVLGTEFNIKAYKDESRIYTTLVEGKVKVISDKVNKNLIPNQQSDLNVKTNNIKITTVDVYNEVSWKEGLFVFSEKSLKDIMKVLSRWYDMNVVFMDTEIEKEEFNGLLRKDQEIEGILSSIKNFGIIKSYEIKGKEVIIK